jgi:cytochrome c oxidase subunit I+III
MIAIGIISFGLWVHHMFSAGLSILGMSLFAAASMAIAVPSGIQVAAWIVTVWKGRLVLNTSMLFALGFIVTFVVGGVTGVMVAAIPFDWQVHDTYFVVGHFHYVLVGGVIFPIFAGFYYWLPKMVGRMLDEHLGRLNFWLMFAGFQLAFFPMHISGLLGMPRRVYTYPAGLGWELPNLISTIGAYVLGLGILLFVYNIYRSIVLGRGDCPSDDPWNAGTLDWATPTPPPDEGYRTIPLVYTRYPLWQQPSLDGESPGAGRSEAEADVRASAERAVRGLAVSPAAWRAQLVTSVVTAEPQAIVRLSGPSIWPLLAAITLTLNFVATLFDLYWLLAASTVATIAAVIAWLWPTKEERERRLVTAADRDDGGSTPDPQDATLHGLPVYTSGTSAPGWWTMMHIILIMGVSTACLVMSYFFLAAGAPVWPPDTHPQPDLLLPALISVVSLGSGLACWWAERRIRRGAQGHLKLGLGLSMLCGIAAFGLLVWQLMSSGISPSAHAYDSAVVTLIGYQGVLIVGGLILLGVTLVQSVLGYFDGRRFLAVQNTANYHLATTANWFVIMFVVHLSPHLI